MQKIIEFLTILTVTDIITHEHVHDEINSPSTINELRI